MSTIRVTKPNPYQSTANALPGTVEQSGIVHVGGRPAFEPRSSVGTPAGGAGQVARTSLHADTSHEGPDAVRTMVRRDAWAAADHAYASQLSQTMTLNGLGRAIAYARPSGSSTRHLRVGRIPSQQMLPSSRLFAGFRGFGDPTDPTVGDPVATADPAAAPPGATATAATATTSAPVATLPSWLTTTDWATSCKGFDKAKYAAPIFAFLADALAQNPNTAIVGYATAAAAVFGQQPVGCFAFQLLAAGGAVPVVQLTPYQAALQPALGTAWPDAATYAVVNGLSVKDVVCALKAGKRMRGHWSPSWHTRWWLFSGYTPFYLNPLILAGGALVGVGGYRLLRKKR